MLNIHTSNRLEILARLLAACLREDPVPLFEPQVVVTAGPAIARWLNLQLCRCNGIAANIDFPLPATYLWFLAGQCLEELPDEDPLSREAMAWRIFGLMPGMLDDPRFRTVDRYLAGDRDGIRRWQLSQRIADVFDRYQYYRPELILEWDQADSDQDWQAALWRAIQPPEAIHRVEIARRLMALLDADELPVALPHRIHWFAVQTLPPMLVQVLGALARHCEVDLWLLSPTEHYWGDLRPEKALIRKRMENPEAAALWETGNLLLASWGRQGQAFQDLLLEQPGSDVIDHHQAPERNSLLHHVQANLYELTGDGRPGAEPTQIDPDDSLRVHVCHSPLRECQVLHDQLLAMMQANDTLKPEDILVLVPEISRYAPFIEAVFQKADQAQGQFIPWNLSDISLTDEHPLIRIFLQLLALPESRFSLPEVLGYLDVPEVAGRFGLGGDDAALIRDWLDRARVYWGLDGNHKRKLGLPEVEENTWQQAFRRLFCGYALGESGHYGDIAPVANVEGMNAAALGRFWQILETLKSWAIQLQHPRTGAEWQRTLNRLLETFFVTHDDEDGRLQHIRDQVAELSEKAADLTVELTPGLIRHWLTQSLGTRTHGGRYYSGGVTFCGMKPLRGVPFRVVCLLGIQDDAFPRRDTPSEFDRMQERHRHGDPHPGVEDRALFLETLLAARDRLYISYTGRAVKDDSELQPSVLVRELLDYLDRHYTRGDGEAPVSKTITTEHPLQPFSPRNYDFNDPVSFDPWWLQTARALREEAAKPVQQPWPILRLPELESDSRTITPGKLVNFLAQPCKGFVRTRLRLFLDEVVWEPDSEPFELDSLEAYQIKDRLIADCLQGRETSANILRAEGLVPHGATGNKVFSDQVREVQKLLQELEALNLQGSPPISPEVSLELTDTRGRDWVLQGRITRLWPERGLIRFRPASLKGKDVLALWLDHLLWIMVEGTKAERRSLHLAANESFALATGFGPETASRMLLDLFELYWQGLHTPLPVFEKATWAWAKSWYGKGRSNDNEERKREKALNAAKKQWNGNDHNHIPGDRDDPYVQLLLRGTSGHPLETGEFPQLAERFYGQIFEYREQKA